jgi:hypothetical protein
MLNCWDNDSDSGFKKNMNKRSIGGKSAAGLSGGLRETADFLTGEESGVSFSASIHAGFLKSGGKVEQFGALFGQENIRFTASGALLKAVAAKPVAPSAEKPVFLVSCLAKQTSVSPKTGFFCSLLSQATFLIVEIESAGLYCS